MMVQFNDSPVFLSLARSIVRILSRASVGGATSSAAGRTSTGAGASAAVSPVGGVSEIVGPGTAVDTLSQRFAQLAALEGRAERRRAAATQR